MRRMMKRPENDSPANGPVRDAAEIDDPAGILAGAPEPTPVGRRRLAPVQSAPIMDEDEERAAIQAEAAPSLRTPRGTPMQSNVIPPDVKATEEIRSVQGASVETVTVVWPEELFSPIQFHTYKVGPFTATVNRKPGEAIQEACARAMGQLDAFAKQERMRKHDDYMAHVKLIQSRK